MLNKTFTTAAAASIALIGTAAAAENYFTYTDEAPQEPAAALSVGTVVSDMDGTVVIYDYNGAEFGEVLGEIPVAAGTNSDVEVQVGQEPISDVAAVLYHGEPTTPADAAAWIEIDIEEMEEM